MILLLDVGNTHTHLGLANDSKVLKQVNIRTSDWVEGIASRAVRRFTRAETILGVAVCSVVPRVTPLIRQTVRRLWNAPFLELTPATLRGVGIDYPRPATIGPDRLANGLAAFHRFGAPVVVVDFGTAVTFDVIDRRGSYVGGIIAPGLAAMTDYLHEKTALLPRIKIRETQTIIGKSTEEAMLIGAVHGYRGLVRELVTGLKQQLKARRLPVVATGGYAELMAARLPEITAVDPDLTLEGLRLLWQSNQAERTMPRPPFTGSARSA